MSLPDHWEIQRCPLCDYYGRAAGCSGTRNEPHERVETETVEVVRASTAEEAEAWVMRLYAMLSAEKKSIVLSEVQPVLSRFFLRGEESKESRPRLPSR